MFNLKDKILFCLEKYPSSRNSDIELTTKVWYEFHNSKIKVFDDEQYVKLKDLYDLPREDDVKRVRAKIQNDKFNPRFLPTDEKIINARRQRELKYREVFSPSNPARG